MQHYCKAGRQFLNRSSPGKVRMRCGMTGHPPNKHCNARALSHKVKCGCSVQRIKTNINNQIASKHATMYRSAFYILLITGSALEILWFRFILQIWFEVCQKKILFLVIFNSIGMSFVKQ